MFQDKQEPKIKVCACQCGSDAVFFGRNGAANIFSCGCGAVFTEGWAVDSGLAISEKSPEEVKVHASLTSSNTKELDSDQKESL